MPQQFQTLRCYSCEKFQVHQIKKATKWQCKVCGEKQSLKKAYFVGSARDCRFNVQQLNFEDGERKQNLVIEQGNECSDNFKESPPVNQNHVDESESSGEPFQSSKDSTSLHDHYIPRKKARYEPDLSYETYSENQSILSSIFLEDNETNSLLDQSRSSLDILSHEENISFDITFDLPSPSSKASDIAVESILTDDLKSKSDHCLNVDAQLPSKRAVTTKNRGFQLILNAAKKLA